MPLRCCSCDTLEDLCYYDKKRRQEATNRIMHNLNDKLDRLEKLRSANCELKSLIRKVDEITTDDRELTWDYDCSLCKKILFDSSQTKHAPATSVKYRPYREVDSLESDNYYYFDTDTDTTEQSYYTPRVFKLNVDPHVYPVDTYPDPFEMHLEDCACCQASSRHRSEIRSRSRTRSKSRSRRASASSDAIRYEMKEPWLSDPYRTNYPWKSEKIEDMRSN